MSRHRDLDLLVHRLGRAYADILAAEDNLSEQRAQISNLAAQDYSSSTRGGGIANPTLSTVQQLDGINRCDRDLTDAVQTLQVCVKMLETSIDAARRYRASRDDIELDSERDLLVQCVECEQIRTPRTDPQNGMTLDDGRCLDCGTRHDRVQADLRRKSADERRARRYGQSQQAEPKISDDSVRNG